MSVEELEQAVERLSAAELGRFAEWFDAYRADEWDRQFEADVQAGRLDQAGRNADEDFEQGRTTRL